MAVVHRWWLLPLADARAAFSALATMDDLLSPDVTRRMSEIRGDASRTRLLITARLDPTDSEEWQAILDPPTDDYGSERSAAARLVGLLAAVAREAGELHSSPAVSSPSSLIEAHLVAAGWTRGSIETTLRGRPIAELFAQLAPQLRAVTAKCQPWLVGGWLDRETAAVLAMELDRAIAELERVRGSVVSKLARGTAFSESEIDQSLRTAEEDLHTMLQQPDWEHDLWIIED